MHHLLEKLLEEHLPDDLDANSLAPLLHGISHALDRLDTDRQIQENLLRTVSEELNRTKEEIGAKLIDNNLYQKQLEEALAKQQLFLDASPEAIISFSPNGIISHINRAGCKFLDLSEDELAEENSSSAVDLVRKKLADQSRFQLQLDKIEKNQSVQLHGYLDTIDGRYFEYYSIPEFLKNKYLGRVWCFRDLTDIKDKQALLKHQAFHDALTDLPNRMLLQQSLMHAIDLAKRNGTQVAVCFVDLDDFKKINDTAGHAEGDRFLIEVSKRIKGVLRECDILGRLGGDEFLIILEGVHNEGEVNIIDERILKLFKQSFSIGENQYVISCSIGMSIFPKDGDDPEELIRKADMAMYQAKKNGKNNFQYFDENLELTAMYRVSIETQLREAIQQKSFILHYQPKIDLKENKIKGVETLIRWVRPDGELSYPDTFIPVAEDTGAIRHITYWVIDTVCKKLKEWQRTPLKGIPISINISAVDFSDKNFLDQVLATLDKYQIDTTLLEFELTESVFFDDIHRVNSIILAPKSRSIQLSIDDFGTGYSSFKYLQALNIDYLKIDRSFVQGLHQNSRAKSIVKSVIDVGINLDLEVVAEGVETRDDLEFLQTAGCHIGQGYYFSRPIAEEKLLQFVKDFR